MGITRVSNWAVGQTHTIAQDLPREMLHQFSTKSQTLFWGQFSDQRARRGAMRYLHVGEPLVPVGPNRGIIPNEKLPQSLSSGEISTKLGLQRKGNNHAHSPTHAQCSQSRGAPATPPPPPASLGHGILSEERTQISILSPPLRHCIGLPFSHASRSLQGLLLILPSPSPYYVGCWYFFIFLWFLIFFFFFCGISSNRWTTSLRRQGQSRVTT